MVGLDYCGRKTEEMIDLTHPAGVALRKVIVYRHQVCAFAAERVQKHRRGCNKRFTFAGFHFAHIAFVQNHTTYKLYVVMTLFERTRRGLTYQCKCVGQYTVQRLFLKPCAQLICLLTELFVGHFFVLWRKLINNPHTFPQALDSFGLRVTQNTL